MKMSIIICTLFLLMLQLLEVASTPLTNHVVAEAVVQPLNQQAIEYTHKEAMVVTKRDLSDIHLAGNSDKGIMNRNRRQTNVVASGIWDALLSAVVSAVFNLCMGLMGSMMRNVFTGIMNVVQPLFPDMPTMMNQIMPTMMNQIMTLMRSM